MKRSEADRKRREYEEYRRRTDPNYSCTTMQWALWHGVLVDSDDSRSVSSSSAYAATYGSSSSDSSSSYSSSSYSSCDSSSSSSSCD